MIQYPHNSRMNFDRRLLKYVEKYKFQFILIAGLIFFSAILIILQAFILSKIISDVFLLKKSLQELVWQLFIFLIISILCFIIEWKGENKIFNIAHSIKKEVEKKTFSHICHLGPAYIRKQKTGELANTLLTGMNKLEAYFAEYLPQCLKSVFIPIGILFFIFPIDQLSGFILLFTAPLIPFFIILIADVVQLLTQKQWTALTRMSGFFLDVLQGFATIKVFGATTYYTVKIKKISKEFHLRTMKVLKIAFLSAMVLEIIATISIAIIAVEVGLRLLYSKLEFCPALFILILAPEFYMPLRKMGSSFHAGMEGFSAAQSIFEILQQSRPAVGKILHMHTIEHIVFDNVTYSYEGQPEPALENFNLVISSGQKITLIGPNGSGKTTLVNLLLKFIQPQQGVIKIQNVPLGDIESNYWRQNIAWVPQHPYLFHKTIAENIQMANPIASNKELIQVVKNVCLYEFIQSLQNGLDTVIGDRGTRLSGGQAQRIALARALIKDAPILIFDEPTVFLDVETEKEIQKIISQLTKNKTVIFITHKLNNIEKSDQIIFMSKGRIVNYQQ